MNVGPMELMIVAALALLLFGAGRIADVGKGLGQGIKNFKQGLKEADEVGGKKELKAADETSKDDSKAPPKEA